jgi:hypothetical protein
LFLLETILPETGRKKKKRGIDMRHAQLTPFESERGFSLQALNEDEHQDDKSTASVAALMTAVDAKLSQTFELALHGQITGKE